MRFILIKCLLILGCVSLTNQLTGQLMGIRHYKIGEASSQTKIFTIFKNYQGYIYAGTANGLYKFDGLNFTLVPLQNSGPAQSVSCIFEDAQKQLWVGMQSGNIAILAKDGLQFYKPEEGTPKKPITSFLEDGQGNIWFATDGE